ncbi:MAG TPA: OmpA family protein [Thermoanaerobaculia bacterium]|nr:OmpA family protein [Thermoanaerobaculia bacterium]
MMRRGELNRLVVVLAALAAATGCAKRLELKMTIDVLSEPGKADVEYRNKPIGTAPQRVNIDTFDDLESIRATTGDGQIVEKRIRILSPETAQVIFRFAKEPSPLAKKLGASRLLVFEYSEKVSFDSNKSDLKPEALPILNKQREILNTYFPNAKAYVCGYTDSTGRDELNLKLSLDRANAVANYLEAGGVARSRLEPKGFGKDFPIETNATPVGRAFNRRTEVVLPQ